MGRMQVSLHTGNAYASKMHVEDLVEISKEIGLILHVKMGVVIWNTSLKEKRSRLARVHLKVRQEAG
ncbi:MAG: hypothetical protein FDW93_01180 [Bergeyella sp.]|nr:hypothetical protein [Bergeyella sp.]